MKHNYKFYLLIRSLKNIKKLNILFLFLIIVVAVLFIKKLSFVQREDDIASLESLKSLPYLEYTDRTVDRGHSGVVKYIPELAFEGYNLYGGWLMDMEGNMVHGFQDQCGFPLILDNGTVITGDDTKEKLIKCDLFSRRIWGKNLAFHHDIALTHGGNILVIVREVHIYKNRNVYFDVVTEFSPEGKELFRWSTFENLSYLKKFHEPSPLDKPGPILGLIKHIGKPYDYYHLNAIQELPETLIGKKDKRFQQGNWLISLNHFDLIAILDKETKAIVWSWGPGEVISQHMPRMLENGNILVFDNGSEERGYSRVIELNPIEKKIIWEYKADPHEDFFSIEMGSAQRLPNGNTLIAESTRGRAFEITKNGDIVWEWFFPRINRDGKRQTVYRVLRIPKEKIDNFLHKDNPREGGDSN